MGVSFRIHEYKTVSGSRAVLFQSTYTEKFRLHIGSRRIVRKCFYMAFDCLLTRSRSFYFYNFKLSFWGITRFSVILSLNVKVYENIRNALDVCIWTNMSFARRDCFICKFNIVPLYFFLYLFFHVSKFFGSIHVTSLTFVKNVKLL